jgi:TonB-like protein
MSMPAITPPILTNRDEIVAAVARLYPEELSGVKVSIPEYDTVIDTIGRVSSKELVKSSGYPILDRQSGVIIDMMRFHPALAGNCRTALRVRFPINWGKR